MEDSSLLVASSHSSGSSEETLYRYSVHFAKDAGELTPPSAAYSLHSVVYDGKDKLVAIWVNTGSAYVVEDWGQTEAFVPQIEQGACG